MVNTSHVVHKLVDKRIYIQEAMNKNIISYWSLARQIQPEIEEELEKPVKTHAIEMALRRYADQLKQKHKTVSFDYSSDIIMKTQICDISVSRSPTLLDKIKKLLTNYRDRYLLDAENFPGGCIFIMFAVELGDCRPHLSREVQKGFIGLKSMIKRLLDESKESGEFSNGINTDIITEILFNGILGASVNYSVDKSFSTLDHSINSLIDYIDKLKR